MNTLLKKSVLFALMLIVGYCFFILIWGLFIPKNFQKNLLYKLGGKGHMYSRMQEVKHISDVDILFVGSSLALRGFDPRVFDKHGYKTFNLGSGGQTPLQSEWLIERYIDQLKPKVIILEVNPYIISRDGTEAALDLISNHEFEWSMVSMAFEINNIKVYNTLIYAWWRKFLSLNRNYIEPVVKNEDTYIPGGYIEREISYFNITELDREIIYEMKPVSYQKTALENTVDFVNTKGIELILVQPPVTNAGFAAYKDDYNVDQFFSGIGNYYNCNYYLELNDSLHFYDSRHLNQKGVELFNEALISDILQLDVL